MQRSLMVEYDTTYVDRYRDREGERKGRWGKRKAQTIAIIISLITIANINSFYIGTTRSV